MKNGRTPQKYLNSGFKEIFNLFALATIVTITVD